MANHNDTRSPEQHGEHRADEDLRIQQALAGAILDSADVLALVLDRDGRIVKFDRGCERLTGLRSAEVAGKRLWDLGIVAPEDLPKAVAGVERVLAGEALAPWESRWLDGAGARHVIAWSNRAIRDERGEVSHVVRIGLDLTDLRAAEERAAERLQELSHLHRVQTAGELASMLAHELNQPLAAVAQYAAAARALLVDHGGTGKAAQYLERIAEQALRAGHTITELRKFLSKAAPAAARIDPNATMRAVRELTAPYARARRVEIALDLGRDLGPVWASEVLVEQILVNLVRNAVESIAGAGVAHGTVTLTTRATGGAVRFTVNDTGPGLAGEAAERVFAPFYTTKTNGLGMGLRIARSLAEAQGGRLWAEPRAPGAVFHLELPLAP